MVTAVICFILSFFICKNRFAIDRKITIGYARFFKCIRIHGYGHIFVRFMREREKDMFAVTLRCVFIERTVITVARTWKNVALSRRRIFSVSIITPSRDPKKRVLPIFFVATDIGRPRSSLTVDTVKPTPFSRASRRRVRQRA